MPRRSPEKMPRVSNDTLIRTLTANLTKVRTELADLRSRFATAQMTVSHARTSTQERADRAEKDARKERDAAEAAIGELETARERTRKVETILRELLDASEAKAVWPGRYSNAIDAGISYFQESPFKRQGLKANGLAPRSWDTEESR